MKHSLSITVLLISVLPVLAERINHAGRILGALPAVTNSILFNSTNADAVVSAMQILPVTNPWNEDISRRPMLSNSDAMIAQISADLLASRRTLRAFKEMNYVLVPDFQATAPINFFDYPDESDLDGGTFPNGLYPIPSNMPIETWPSETGGLTLPQWQQAATFNAPGVYTLMLSATDGVHAVAYDAVVITVSPAITLAIAPAGANVNLKWTGGSPPFVVERANALPAGSWAGVLTTSVQNASVPRLGSAGFFRVKEN